MAVDEGDAAIYYLLAAVVSMMGAWGAMIPGAMPTWLAKVLMVAGAWIAVGTIVRANRVERKVEMTGMEIEGPNFQVTDEHDRGFTPVGWLLALASYSLDAGVWVLRQSMKLLYKDPSVPWNGEEDAEN